jgi:Zn-dependent peptidase ImmA (M78 family)
MDKMKLRTQAEQIRKHVGEDSTSPIDIFSLVRGIPTVTLVIYPFGEHISGACIKSPTSAVIAINSTQTLGRQRFSLAHEIYHYFFNQTKHTTICPTAIDSGDIEERNADRFASYLLVPPVALAEQTAALQENARGTITVNDVVRLEQHFQVSRKAMLFRLREEKLISLAQSRTMEQNVKQSALNLGYELTLYEPRPKDKQKTTLGYYIEKVQKLYEENKISTGKYESYLLDAFREDIVFGLESSEEEYVD